MENQFFSTIFTSKISENPDLFLQIMKNQQFPATPTRKPIKPIFSQLIMSSPDLLESQLSNKSIKILIKPKKRRAMASSMQSSGSLLKDRVNVNKTSE